MMKVKSGFILFTLFVILISLTGCIGALRGFASVGAKPDDGEVFFIQNNYDKNILVSILDENDEEKRSVSIAMNSDKGISYSEDEKSISILDESNHIWIINGTTKIIPLSHNITLIVSPENGEWQNNE